MLAETDTVKQRSPFAPQKFEPDIVAAIELQKQIVYREVQRDKRPSFKRLESLELRTALEEKLGMSYKQMLAETMAKLFADFQKDKHIGHFLAFTEQMNRRLLESDRQDTAVAEAKSEVEVDEDLRNKAISKMHNKEENNFLRKA
jgi:ribosomal protein L10